MNDSKLVLILLLIALPVLIGGPTLVGADVEEPIEWAPFPLEEVNRVLDSQTLSQTEKVETLTRHLDKRISMSRYRDGTGINPGNPPYEYIRLMGRIARNSAEKDAPARVESISAVLDGLDAMPDIVNKEEVRAYLYVALAYAGGNVPDSQLLTLLDNPAVKHTPNTQKSEPETPDEMVNFILQVMLSGKVPIRALPQLLALSAHPLQITKGVLGRGPDSEERMFPIRERACEGLKKLGIRCEKVLVKDRRVLRRNQHKFSTTIIQVDYQSVATKLREWLLSNDPAVWQAAAEVAPAISEEKVQAMMKELLQSNKLSAEKKQSLAK